MKIKSVYEKLEDIAYRHDMSIHKACLYELFILLYKKAVIRGVLKIFFKRANPSGWYFLVGCYNSGTTVIKDAVALHPLVTSAPIEGDGITSELSKFEEGGWPRSMVANAFLIGRHRCNGELESAVISSDWRPWIKENKFYLEKSISNSVRIKLLRKAFDKSKFICVFRNSGDVIRGIQKRSKPSLKAEFFLDNERYSEESLERQWKFVNSKIISDYKTSDCCFCSYESFLLRPVEELKSIYNFLELPEVEISLKGNILKVAGRSILLRRGKITESDINFSSIYDVERVVKL